MMALPMKGPAIMVMAGTFIGSAALGVCSRPGMRCRMVIFSGPIIRLWR